MARSKRIHFRGFQSCPFHPPLPCHGVSYGHTILRGVVTNVSNRIESNRTESNPVFWVRFGSIRSSTLRIYGTNSSIHMGEGRWYHPKQACPCSRISVNAKHDTAYPKARCLAISITWVANNIDIRTELVADSAVVVAAVAVVVAAGAAFGLLSSKANLAAAVAAG